ncbi:tripartite tricarboxylate transporter substrate binding protein [Oceaniovalibus sp. ACAM 378]|uniref:Bug family tripartite tricarboxylate transporter substrate binding protein n=1 Tax=Oceaniovalibus sp. ACAM 378 TaxID=2599923 RepID=UPI0011D69CEB|nr:tripartite tricarboxylate transporter substrate binding protein [Oceaniovalibus sp. ACAM 378]TYB83602.1 tripartite tricarboxylate transporter substrate binding protein [Oceaniovalibus sp. ACAM 378]
MQYFTKTIIAATMAIGLTAPLAAQADFPTQELRIIVPFSPGGSTDIMARLIVPMLKEQGVTAVVENLPGGGSAVGMGQVATAKPDGYTIGLASSSLLSLIAQEMVPFKKDAYTDLVRFSEDPLILLVKGSSEFKDLTSFMDHMKANPGTVTIGTPGTNNVNHAMAELTNRAGEGDYRHVTYPGGSRVIAEILGGQIDAGVLKPSETMAQMEAGEMRALGVYRNGRIESLPDVETFAEAGYNLFESGELAQVTFLTAPAGLDPAVRDRLIEIFSTAVMSDEFQEFSTVYGFIADGLSGDELETYNSELMQALEVAASEIFTDS